LRVALQVERLGARWAVKHNGGFLGQVATYEEAIGLARSLHAFLAERGRDADLMIEEVPGAAATQRAA
jgi:hypothetical protein